MIRLFKSLLRAVSSISKRQVLTKDSGYVSTAPPSSKKFQCHAVKYIVDGRLIGITYNQYSTNEDFRNTYQPVEIQEGVYIFKEASCTGNIPYVVEKDSICEVVVENGR